MYADSIEVVIRQTDSPYGGELEDAVAFRTFPEEGGIEAEAVTGSVRHWMMEHGYTRTTFEERRRYTDAGAAGVSLGFILELLGAGATGVALQEIVNYVKARVGAPEEGWMTERFQSAANDELRDSLITETERMFDLRRGDLEVEEFERERFEIRMLARSPSSGRRYRIVQNTDGTIVLHRVDDGV